MDKAEEAVEGQGSYPLTNEQKKRLVCAVKAAYDVQRSFGWADEPFDVWRRGALADATQETSIRALRQRQYNTALKYFLGLAGREAAARRVRGEGEDKRLRAVWALWRECGGLADAFGGQEQAQAYASALFTRIHRTTSERATAKQIWAVIFTMRNRVAAKRLKEQGGSKR